MQALLLLTLCLGVLPEVVRAGRSGATTGEVLLYEFAQSQCASGEFTNGAAGSHPALTLTRDTSLTSCITGAVGVSSSEETSNVGPNVRSATSWSDVLDKLKISNEMTIEMWIKPFDATAGLYEEIFTIASESYVSSWNGNHCSTNDSGNGWYDLKVEQDNSKLLVKWAGQTVTKTSFITQTSACKEFNSNINIPTDGDGNLVPFHFAMTFGQAAAGQDASQGLQKVYINGADVAGEFDLSNQNFTPNDSFHADYHLDFFSSEFLHHTPVTDNFRPWPGNLYLFAMYDKVLTPSEVVANYNAKLGNSLPTVTATTITINEEAEVSSGGHYPNPDWYGSAPPVSDLASFDLTSQVSDADVDTVDYPNYDGSAAAPTLWVGSLPGFGNLYQNDGTEITATDTLIASNNLKFRPVLNSNGASVDTFQVYAKDGTTSEPSVGLTTITMDVTAVNDPPIPTNEVREAAVLVGVLTTSIFDLAGSDVDDVGLTGGYISAFPEHGELYAIESDGTTFGAQYTSATADSEGDVQVGLKVGYKFTGDESAPSATGFLTNDQFTFKLYDAAPTKSKTATTSFEVFTSLEATPVSADTFSCTEEELSDVVLKGNDQSTENRNLRYRIDSLPSHGQLFDPVDTTTPLAIGDIVTAEDVHDGSAYSGVTIKYKGEADYFNYPTVMYNTSTVNGGIALESFTYNAVVASATSAKSLPATQQIKVVNVNDETELTGPSGEIAIYALNAPQRAARTEFCAIEANAEHVRCTTNEVAQITSVYANEVDKDVDRVVVHIYTDKQNGRFSLNNDVLGLADFVSCNIPKISTGRTWTCKGDGSSDAEMKFLAQPSDLNRLLHGFEYENFVQDSWENITIVVYDGIGNDEGCQPEAEHTNAGSIRSGCFITNVTITMRVTEYDPESVTDPTDVCGWLPNCMQLPYQVMLGMFGAVLIMLCCICSCIKRKCRRRSARKKEAREAKKKAKLEMPEIAGRDLEEGVRDNRGGGALHGNGFKDIASKGLGMAEGGLNKAKKTGLGGPAVGIALKGVKMAEKKLNSGGAARRGSKETLIPSNSPSKKNPIRQQSGMSEKDEEVAKLTDPDALPPPPALLGPPSSPKRSKPPPPPLKKKTSSKILAWLGYRDSGTGEMYYENTEDGRVTWTEPKEGFKPQD
ncbi:hypothetical protein TrVE_jg344 [Triparma verrucosa]|uniref:Cadherin domain-containing protein n=1 Tax=Triparma verrucosa TaxID=1606542 RepID=A0A9W7F3L0_9STRA|nr:hypothetical protein TrVE_jg344 [Triparma verrucosa]